MTERTDPEQAAELDGDQLDAADTLEQVAVEDVLDEGYSPQERDTRSHWGETPLEESLGEPLDSRLAQEVPDTWDHAPRGRENDRAGRLEAVAEGTWGQDSYARDAGLAGGAASAEEAAVHTVSLDDLERIETAEADGEDPVYDEAD
ncbi:MAG TPA: hypothetical protein DHV14_13450 [Micrococcales bacterium]|uniref:DUF5709 domain-containing protein n=1 Tax=Miniimonas arenae TaxID=676201 RepID=A0A5C5BBF9_9MICO|nr:MULTISPECIES: DUF5709 domain-containing protein [Miniimonas]TNU73864.1 hypothetical protein FH969_09250 [Miniimonas arenae]HCX86111.1 hypothetical protein [Micrococcales bacterium]